MSIKTLADPTIAYALATEKDWAYALITVFAPGTLFVSGNKEQLEQSEGGNQQGAQFTAANTSGTLPPGKVWFIGTLYGRASVRGQQVDISVFAQRADTGATQSGAHIPPRGRC